MSTLDSTLTAEPATAEAATGSAILDVLRAAAATYGDKPAVVDSTGAGYSYREFLAAIEAGAAWFHGRDPRPPVLFVPGNGPDDVVALYAAITGGSVPLVADKTWTAEECARIAEATGASAVLASVDSALDRTTMPATDSPWPKLWWSELGPTRRNDRLDGIGFGRFTSGTTGMPRCLGFTQQAAVNAANAWRRSAELTERDTVLCLATLNNGLAFNTSLLSVFLSGATLVLHAGRPIPSSIARSIRKVEPTVLTAFPFVFDGLVRGSSDLGRGLRLSVSSAAPLSPETADAWQDLTGLRICDYYGLAEVGPVTFNDSSAPGSVGVPLHGVEIVIEPVAGVDEADGRGRVLVRTASMASRYLDEGEPVFADSLTAEGFLRSKDLGRLDEAGRLWLVGRLGQVVNVAGRKIDPTEVANVIRELPGVTEVVVRGEQSASGELLAAYVESTTVDRAAVVEHCRGRLAVYKLPQRITIAGSLPRNAAGKISSSALSTIGE
ncbi:class I adenylate-forming enzyme family protein [Micromonospora sp. CPCC 206060]|uniref:class I adenylate-forming enzyme family protein n=1 Tax=Micromonospora sp. CPCC 206060 TaxID=3122406 RepID=UPI002FF2A0D7